MAFNRTTKTAEASTRRLTMHLEFLEPRILLSVSTPTNYDQYLLELINYARANPSAAAALYGIDLNEGLAPGTISTTAKQPLAFNVNLLSAAQLHSQWMITTDIFSHTGSGNSQPNDRMTAAGYTFTGTWAWGENIGWTGTTGAVNMTEFTAEVHHDLFVDEGIAGRGHRVNLLNGVYKEIGLGVVHGAFTYEGTAYNSVMITEDFALSGSTVYLTGVAYDDGLVAADNFYTPGEGLGSISIVARRTSDNAVFSTTTWASGGYTLALAAGTYTVTATGAALGGTMTYTNVVIGTDNVKRDFVLQINHAPTLTTIAPLTGAAQDTPFTITYNMLAAAANEADTDGDTLSFRVQAVTTGTLRKNGVVVTPGTTLLGPGESLVWTPPAGVTGTRNAFTVKAWDGALASTSAIQVRVQVDPVNHAPTLSQISVLAGAMENSDYTITYAALAAAANEADSDGDPLSFRVESVTSGTLTKNGVAVTPGATTLAAGESLVWRPDVDANGTLDAFTVAAYDGELASGAVQVRVNVQEAPNLAPTLTTVSPLAGAQMNEDYVFDYATLAAAANEADADGDTISFRVESVTAGTLRKNGADVTPGDTLISAGDSLVWTPPEDIAGTLVAFTVKAWDGRAASAQAVPVRIVVAPPPGAPDIAGLAPSPALVVHGDPLTLSLAQTSDADGHVARVEFYRDTNGNGQLDLGVDALLGTDLSAEGGWNWTGAAEGWPLGAQTYFARAQDDDGLWSATISAEGWFVARVRSFTDPLQRVVVTVYDCAGPADIGPDDVIVKFGKNDVVSSIKIQTAQAATGLGLVVTGATEVKSISDSRSGAPGAVAFLAVYAPVGSVSLKTGITGLCLNGQSLGGANFAADMDGDGSTLDRTAFVSTGAVKALKLGGTLGGDVLVTGANAKGASLGALSLKTGSFQGDLTAIGSVGTVAIPGNFDTGLISALSLKKLTVKGDMLHAVVRLSQTPDPKLKALGALAVTGWMNDCTIRAAGDIGAITAGGLLNSTIFAGVKDSVVALPADASDFSAAATIKTLTVRGVKSAPAADYFANTLIGARYLGAVTLKHMDMTNDGFAFGVASETLKALSLTQPDRTRYIWGKTWPADDGDFAVIVI